MKRSAVLTATALLAGAVYIGCTQDFDQFEPDGTFPTTGSTTTSATSSSAGSGGSTTSSSSSSASSTASGTGGAQCTAPADCGASTACVLHTCDFGQCSQFNQPDGTAVPPADQVAGDCKTLQCNGMGGEKTIADPQDMPADEPNECTTEQCNVDMPEHAPVAAGMMCATGVCDGAGSCAECLDDMDCTAPDTCDNGTCIGCTDGIQNGTETGIDCGGTCAGCNGTACTVGTDCAANACVDGVCCATACTATCRACNVVGSEGTCTDLAQYQDDMFPSNICTGTMTCNGAGQCGRKNGEPCNQNSQCASNNCAGSGGNKMCAP